MKLFKYEGYQITISEEALLLKPFADIWKRDRSKSKLRALDELGFIYFYSDPRSDYQYIVDDKDRMKAIIEGEGLKEAWKTDKLIDDAITFYESFKTTSALLLDTLRVLVEKLKIQMRDIDLDERDNRGKPIFALNMIVSSVKQATELTIELDKTEKLISSEMRNVGGMRGQQEKSIMEDGLDI